MTERVGASSPADLSIASADEAILRLLGHLRDHKYRFITPTRSVHALVRRRRDASTEDALRDVFGWVRRVPPGVLPMALEQSLLDAELLIPVAGKLLSRIRVSSVGDMLLAHSDPDVGRDAVFLGPDSYRYARFLHQVLADRPPADHALDIGVGAGAGGLTLLHHHLARRVTGTDINPEALRFAGLNARHAGLALETDGSSGLPSTADRYDLIVANPPFISGDNGATYRDGGGDYGSQLALEWASASLERLTPGGRFILYTGAPVVGGVDRVRQALGGQAERAAMSLTYEEIDPDIFGGLLHTEAYSNVERIAAVGAVITAR